MFEIGMWIWSKCILHIIQYKLCELHMCTRLLTLKSENLDEYRNVYYKRSKPEKCNTFVITLDTGGAGGFKVKS